MMESDRLRLLNEYEEKEKAKQAERLRGAQILQHQIDERQQTELLEAEKRDQETKVFETLQIKIILHLKRSKVFPKLYF